MVVNNPIQHDIATLEWQYILHSRLLLITYLLLLGMFTTMTFFDLQTTMLGISICGLADCEANPSVREYIREKGLHEWYHDNILFLILELCTLFIIFFAYFVVPPRSTSIYILLQIIFITSIFYMAVSTILSTFAVATNLYAINTLLETIKYTNML